MLWSSLEEGSHLPKWQAVVFTKCQNNSKKVHNGRKSNLFDIWADTKLHLILLKSSMTRDT